MRPQDHGAPIVVVYANGSAAVPVQPSPELLQDHLQHAVPLASGDEAEVSESNSTSWAESKQAETTLSPGDGAGNLSADRRSILRQFKDQAPARWMAFLHAHFRSHQEAAFFFDVDEKTGRNWWNGVGRPTTDKAMYAELVYPDGYRSFMLPEASVAE